MPVEPSLTEFDRVDRNRARGYENVEARTCRRSAGSKNQCWSRHRTFTCVIVRPPQSSWADHSAAAGAWHCGHSNVSTTTVRLSVWCSDSLFMVSPDEVGCPALPGVDMWPGRTGVLSAVEATP